MAREITIDLNTDQIGPSHERVDVARLIAAHTSGYTRDGRTATLSEDCPTFRTLEGEARRLKEEIDDAVERARRFFEGKAASEPRALEPAAAGIEAAAKPHIATALKVRDVMTREVRTVNSNDRLTIADELMKLGSFRHVVVVDDSGAVAGIVSSRDLFHGALAWSLGLGRSALDKSLATYPVKQVMTGDVVTISPEADLHQAATLMTARKIGCLPVVDGAKLVGILTEGDFLAILTGA